MQGKDEYTFLLQPSRRRQLVRQIIYGRIMYSKSFIGVRGLLYTYLTASTPICPLNNLARTVFYNTKC